MKKYLLKLLKKIFDSNNYQIINYLDYQSILLGQILTNQQRLINSNNINDNEFKVFSQFGDDGIIQFLFNNIEIKNYEKRFIEIGVGDYSESNTRFLYNR